MKIVLLFCGLLLSCSLSAQSAKPRAQVERVTVDYMGQAVEARRLTVTSEIPMPIEQVWANVKTPALLEFVAKGKIRFKPVSGSFPEVWQAGKTYAVKMRLWGFLPFGGTHYLYVKKIDKEAYELATEEWDRKAKVWNHDVVLRDLGGGRTYYEDSITIYGGWMTGLITRFAKRFYIHRQKRWQVVAANGLDFAP